MEEILSGGKSWGIEDAIARLEKEVEKLDCAVALHRSQLARFEDERNSLSIGLIILEKLYEEKLAVCDKQ